MPGPARRAGGVVAPPHPQPVASAETDLAACRELLRGGSRTFLAASRLLPSAVRDPACALYAFCRVADDAVDGADRDARAVERLYERLERVYAGRPLPHPADRALGAVVERFAIPRALPEALLEGFAWDAAGRRYDSLDAVCDYAARVAGSVGAMMALLMGAREPAALARACDLGIAMQLSNIARDAGEDARAGRLYLPLQWLREAGLDPEAWLAAPAAGPALAAVVQRLLVEADRLYDRAASGIACLPRACRPGIHAARVLYREIGHEVRRRGLNPVDARAVVSPARKLGALARALVVVPRSAPGALPLPPLPAAHFLVQAVQAAPAARPAPGPVAWWQLTSGVVRTIELFERLERRDPWFSRRPA
jgi:phytoene synthase